MSFDIVIDMVVDISEVDLFDLLVDVFELFVDVFEFLFEDVEIGEVVFDDMVFVLVELLFVVDEGFVLDDCMESVIVVLGIYFGFNYGFGIINMGKCVLFFNCGFIEVVIMLDFSVSINGSNLFGLVFE